MAFIIGIFLIITCTRIKYANLFTSASYLRLKTIHIIQLRAAMARILLYPSIWRTSFYRLYRLPWSVPSVLSIKHGVRRPLKVQMHCSTNWDTEQECWLKSSTKHTFVLYLPCIWRLGMYRDINLFKTIQMSRLAHGRFLQVLLSSRWCVSLSMACKSRLQFKSHTIVLNSHSPRTTINP